MHDWEKVTATFLGLLAFYVAAAGGGFWISSKLRTWIAEWVEVELRKRLEELNTSAAKLARSMEDIGATKDILDILERDARQRALALTSIAVTWLPQMTFTQQIPFATVRNLYYVLPSDDRDNADSDARPKLEAELPQIRAPLLYALAIYRFAMDPARSIEETIAMLREAALFSANRDPYTHRDILLRISQIYRQNGRVPEALRVLGEIRTARSFDRDGHLLCDWSESIIKLQEAFGHDGERALPGLSDAAKSLEAIYENVFGNLSKGQPDSSSRVTIAGESIAYYTAKSIWCHKTCVALCGGEFTGDEETFHEVLDLAFHRCEQIRRTDKDPIVLAIYSLVVAIIGLIRIHDEKMEFLQNIRGLGVFYHNLNSRNAREGWKDHIRACLATSRTIVEDFKRMSEPFEIRYMYSETSERLDSASRFLSDITVLSDAVTDREKFLRYFSPALRAT